jgi:hypothetical protein
LVLEQRIRLASAYQIKNNGKNTELYQRRESIK